MKTDFQEITMRLDASSRGGGIEIDLTSLGYDNEKLTAYQNYLGGGMLGAIQNDCTINNWKNDNKLLNISVELKKYFHDITNHDNEWECQSYEQNQNMPKSAY